MNKLYNSFIAALTIIIVVFSTSSNIYGQNVEFLGSVKSTNNGTFGNSLTSSSNGENLVVHNDQGEVNFYEYRNNTLKHLGLITQTYQKRVISVNGEDFTFYPLVEKGRVISNNNDSNNTLFELDDISGDEIWVADSKLGFFYFYIKVDVQDISYSVVSSSFEILKYSGDLNSSKTIDGSGTFPYDITYTLNPVEKDLSLFGSHVSFENDFTVYINDPQYNGYRGRIVKYVMEGGSWVEKPLESFIPTNVPYFKQFGLFFEYATRNNQAEKSLQVFGVDEIFSTYNFTSGNIAYSKVQGFVPSIVKSFPYYFNSSGSAFGSFTVQETAGKQNLFFTTYEFGDFVVENLPVNSTEFDEIYDVEIYEDFGEIYVHVAGVSGTQEVVETYVTFDNYNFNIVTNGSYVMNNVGNTSTGQLQITKLTEEWYTIYSRNAQKIYFFNLGNDYEFAYRGDNTIDKSDDWSQFGNGYYSNGLNFLFTDTNTNQIDTYRLPYTTINDGEWDSGNTWINGIMPLPNDENAKVIINGNAVNLVYGVNIDNLTLNFSSKLTLNPFIEGGGSISANYVTNNGIIDINQDCFIQFQSGISNGTINAFDNSAVMVNDFTSNGLINFNKNVYNELGINLIGRINSSSDIIITNTTTLNGLIDILDDTKGVKVHPYNNFDLSSGTAIPTFLEIEDINESLATVTFKGIFNIYKELRLISDIADFSNADITMGDGLEGTLSYINYSYINNLTFKNLTVKSSTKITDQSYSGGILKVTDALTVNEKFVLEATNLELNYNSSPDIIKGTHPVSIVAGYDSYIYVDLGSKVSAPFQLNFPIEGQIMEDGPGPFTDAAFSFTVDEINYLSGDGGNGLMLFLNNYDAYSNPIIDISGTKYGVLPGKSWYLEGGENVDSFGGNFTTNLGNTNGFKITDVSELKLNSSKTDLIFSATGDLNNAVFSKMSPATNQFFEVQLLSTSFGKKYTSIADSYFDNPSTWDLGTVPSTEQDEIIVKNLVHFDIYNNETFKKITVEDGDSLIMNTNIEGYPSVPEIVTLEELTLNNTGVLTTNYVDLIINKTLNIDNTLNDVHNITETSPQPTPKLIFNGDAITTSDRTKAHLSYTNITIGNKGGAKEVNIDAKLKVRNGGFFEVEGLTKVKLTNDFVLENSKIRRGGHFIIDNRIDNIPRDYELSFSGDNSPEFRNFEAYSTNDIVFITPAVIQDSMYVKGATGVYLEENASITINGEEDDKSKTANTTPFLLEVGEFAGLSPSSIPSKINISVDASQNRAYLVDANISQINSIGDTLYVIRGTEGGFNTGAIKHIVNNLLASPQLVVNSSNLIEEQPIVTNSTEFVEVFLGVNDPITGNLRNLDKEENVVIELSGNPITNFTLKEVTLTDQFGSVDFTVASIPMSEFSSIITTEPSVFGLDVYLNHTTYTSLKTPAQGILYQFLPEGYIDGQDLLPVVDFLNSLTFRNEDFRTNFSVTWDPSELYSWSGKMSDFPGIENIIELDEVGGLSKINIENKDINGWNIATLNGLVGPPIEPQSIDGGDVQPLFVEEIPEGPPVSSGYSHVIINADGNYLFFDQFYDYITGVSPQLNYTPGVPFELFDKSYILNTSFIFSFEEEGYYGETYEWFKYNDIDDIYESIPLSASSIDIDNVLQAGEYKVILKDKMVSHDFEVEMKLTIAIERGDNDKEYLRNILTEAGISFDAELPFWEWYQQATVDDMGYITAINLDDLSLRSIPNDIQFLTQLKDLSLAKNKIKDIPGFLLEMGHIETLNVSDNLLYFDDFDDLFVLEGTSTTVGNQSFETIETTVKVKHGDNADLKGSNTYGTVSTIWYSDLTLTLIENVGDTYSIVNMTPDDAGEFYVTVTSSGHPGYQFVTDKVTLQYALGDADSLVLQTFLENNSIEFNIEDEFRNWLANETVIDDFGKITSLDLSSLGLTSLPVGLESFTSLSALDLSDNILFYDELNKLADLKAITTVIPQSYQEKVITAEVLEYNSYSNTEMGVEIPGISLDYIWYLDGEPYSNGENFSIDNFTFSDEGQYTLKVTEALNNWPGLEIQVATLNLVYRSLITEEDSLALHQLFTEMNVDFDDTQRIVEWPRFSFDPETGKIIGLDLNELEGVTALTSTIGLFDDLESLKLYESNLTDLPNELWSLPMLNYLDLSKNDFDDEDIVGIDNLFNLRTLWLSENNLTTLPDLSNLNQLLYLIADDNDISNVDFDLSALTNLIHLSLSGNNINSITADFSNMINLKKIDLSNNNLTSWSSALPAGFEELILYSNQLESLINVPNTILLDIADNYLFFDDFEGFDKSSIVKYIPQNYPIYYENIALIEGGSYSVQIPIEIKPEYIFTWYKDGVIQGTFTNNQITLENMSALDVGIYSCFISHTYWSDLNIKIAEIGVGFDCSENLSVAIEPTSSTDFCYNEEITATISTTVSDENVTYAWYKGDVPLQLQNAANLTVHEAGAYSVRIRNANGCIALSDTVHVTTSEIIETPIVVFNGDSLNVSNTYDNMTYQWYLDGEPLDQVFSSMLPTRLGSYTVEAINENGCSALSPNYSLGEDDVTNLEDELVKLHIYPQPADDYLFIDNYGYQIEQLNAFDVSGQAHTLQYSNEQGKARISTSSLTNGMYILYIKTNDGKTVHQKILISN